MGSPESLMTGMFFGDVWLAKHLPDRRKVLRKGKGFIWSRPLSVSGRNEALRDGAGGWIELHQEGIQTAATGQRLSAEGGVALEITRYHRTARGVHRH